MLSVAHLEQYVEQKIITFKNVFPIWLVTFIFIVTNCDKNMEHQVAIPPKI